MFTNEQISSYNDLEMSLFNYIMQNMDKVTYMRIRELADATHVSTTTVLRFCKKTIAKAFPSLK